MQPLGWYSRCRGSTTSARYSADFTGWRPLRGSTIRSLFWRTNVNMVWRQGTYVTNYVDHYWYLYLFLASESADSILPDTVNYTLVYCMITCTCIRQYHIWGACGRPIHRTYQWVLRTQKTRSGYASRQLRFIETYCIHELIQSICEHAQNIYDAIVTRLQKLPGVRLTGAQFHISKAVAVLQ